MQRFLASPWSQLMVYALLVGIAWGTLRSQVSNKVDKTELIEIVTKLNTVDNAQLARLEVLSNDIKVIKAILCSQAAHDSFCKLQ